MTDDSGRKVSMNLQEATSHIQGEIDDLRRAVLTANALAATGVSLSKMTAGALMDLGFVSPENLRRALQHVHDEMQDDALYREMILGLIESLCPDPEQSGASPPASGPRLVWPPRDRD